VKFKKPRDPNTKVPNFKIRDLDADEHRRCFVGSGECENPAVEAQDDGEGKEIYVCAEHVAEMLALGKLIAEMTPNQLRQFDNAIANATHERTT